MEASVCPTARPKHTRQSGRLAPRQEAEALLRGSSYLALRGVTCVVKDGVVHLHGHLPTYYLKQVAQAIVSDIEGIRTVDNHIKIRTSPSRAQKETGSVTTGAADAY